MAQATRWVKLTFPCPEASRCLLRRRRFSSSVRTGIVRTEVAVGTWRLASMFSTIRTAPPRIGWRMSPGRMETRATAFERSPGATAGTSWRASVCSPWPPPQPALGPTPALVPALVLAPGADAAPGASLTMTVTGCCLPPEIGAPSGEGSASGGRPRALSK